MVRTVFFLFVVLGFSIPAEAARVTRAIKYAHGETELEGTLAYDDAWYSKRPGVLVIHEWKGLGEYAKWRAEELVKLGYIAFALDMYGKGLFAEDHEEAARLSGIYRKDRALMRERARVGLEVLKQHPITDVERLAAIGYCFGGTTVLELARSGVDLRGVVSFHGGLSNPNPEDSRKIRGKVLVLHGAEDPFVDKEQVDAFQEEMRAAQVDWQLVLYSGAVHAFTVPQAGDDPSRGVAYHPQADRRSWEAMKTFLLEIFE